MSVFLLDKNINQDFWGFQQYKEHMRELHQKQKVAIQECQEFLNQIDSKQAELLYTKIAVVWSKVTGGAVEGHAAEFGKMMVCHHLDDPLVNQTILDFKVGKDTEYNAAHCEILENEIKVKGGDVFETQCTIHSPLNARVSLAFRVLNYAARRMPFSPNKLNEANCPSYLKESLSLVSSRTCELQASAMNDCSPERLIYQKGVYPSPFTEVLAKAKADKKNGVTGNCFDGSTCGQDYSLCERVLEKVDLYSIKNGNHGFLVFGRWEGLPDDYKTWNPDAIVCDFWDRSIFPVSLIESHLVEFTDRQTQSLVLRNSNFFSVEDFRAQSIRSIPEIEQLLQEFHTISDREAKLKQAQAIVEAIENMPLIHFELLKNKGLSALLSQMRYFLQLPAVSRVMVKESDENVIEQALYSKNLDGIQTAVEAGAQPNENTFFHACVMAGKTKNIEYMKKAIECGATANKADRSYGLALALSITTGDLDFLKLAIDAESQPTLEDIKLSCEITLATGNLYFVEAVVADPDYKAMVRYDLKECAKGRPLSPELRQRLIKLVGINGRDFFQT